MHLSKAPSTRVRIFLRTEVFSPFLKKFASFQMLFARPHVNAKTELYDSARRRACAFHRNMRWSKLSHVPFITRKYNIMQEPLRHFLWNKIVCEYL